MRSPGILEWEPFAAGELTTPDSIEGLLRHPLNVSATYDNEVYGTPKRGQLVYEGADGLMRPMVVAEVNEVEDAGQYLVTHYALVKVNDEVEVVDADGETLATATITSVERVETSERGLNSGVDRITVSYGAGEEPDEPVLLVFPGALDEELAGVVYESTLDDEFALAVEIEGARPEHVAGGNTAVVRALPGVTARSGVLFIRSF